MKADGTVLCAPTPTFHSLSKANMSAVQFTKLDLGLHFMDPSICYLVSSV